MKIATKSHLNSFKFPKTSTRKIKVVNPQTIQEKGNKNEPKENSVNLSRMLSVKSITPSITRDGETKRNLLSERTSVTESLNTNSNSSSATSKIKMFLVNNKWKFLTLISILASASLIAGLIVQSQINTNIKGKEVYKR